MRTTILIFSLALITAGLIAAQERAPVELRPVKRIWLVMHALNWLEVTPESPLRKEPRWELWPGRCEACYQYEQPLKEKYFALLGKPDPDAAVWIMPSGMSGDPPLIELARKTFGDRCLVCPLGYDFTANSAALGEEFAQGCVADRKRATEVRGQVEQTEIDAWERSKAWAVWFTRELNKAGYRFNPQTVKVEALGEDWCGCAATFPIHMSRALGLKTPIWRRFDLMNPDCSKLLVESTLVAQNLTLPRGRDASADIKLLIVKSREGRFVAQFHEGAHGLWEWPHRVMVTFPRPAARRVGTGGEAFQDAPQQTVDVTVGCGGHTPHQAQLLMSEPGVTLKEFKAALLAGQVTEIRKAP